MKKLVETKKVFGAPYNVFDKNVQKIVGVFDTYEDMIHFVKDYFSKVYNKRADELFHAHRKRTPIAFQRVQRRYQIFDYDAAPDDYGYRYPRYKTDYENYVLQGFYVTDYLGDVLDKLDYSVVKAEKNWEERKLAEDHQQKIDSYRVRTKRNPNKIKLPYAMVYRERRWSSGEYGYYNADIIGYFRNTHTAQIFRQIEGVEIEDGEPLVRKKRTRVPTTYDDVTLNVYGQGKSWKHNSKRRKQWKDRDDEYGDKKPNNGVGRNDRHR